MSLPSKWVDSLFHRLSIRYGASFVRQLDGLDISTVKADWAEQLAFFADQPKAIAAALENLPHDFPPNVMQFRDIALKHAKARDHVSLPAPKATKEEIEAARERCKTLNVELGNRDMRAWTYRLKEREERGDCLTLAQRQMWCEAIRAE